jgi:hypothetical protein
MSEKRQYSPISQKDSIFKRHKEESSPPKSMDFILRELGFLQKWETITETNKSKRYYYNSRTHKRMLTTPYQDIEKQQYSGTIIPHFLEKHGPDKTIDYLIELLESYIFHVYEKKKKTLSIRDILRFDVFGYGHGGEKTAKSNSINSKYIPDSITFCMPSNIIGIISHLNPSMDYAHTQYSKNKSLSRSEKTELRDIMSQRYETRSQMYAGDIYKIRIAIQKMADLSEEKLPNPSQINIIIKSTIPRLIEEWCSNEWDDYIIFKYGVERKTQAFRDKTFTEKDVVDAIQAAIEILKEKEHVFIQQQKECVEGSQRSGTDAFKSHNLVTAPDKKKMIPQVQLLSSDSGLYPNVLANFFILFRVQSDDLNFDVFMNDGFVSLRSDLIKKNDMASGKLSYDVDALYENQRGLKPNMYGLPYKMFQKLSVVFSIMSVDYSYISNSTRELDPTKLFYMLSYYGSIPRYTSTSCRSGHDIKELPTYDSEGGNKTRKHTLRGRTLRGRTLRGRKTCSRYIQ